MTQHTLAHCNERGAALAFIIVTGLVASVVAYSLLFMATSQARQARVIPDRMEARYVAEAGLVIALERLQSDSTYASQARCPGGTQDVTLTEQVDVDGNGTGETPVEVTVFACDPTTGNRFSATRSY